MKSILAALAILAASLAGFAQAADPAVRVAIHMDDGDPATMNLALNNIANIQSYYAEKGQSVEIALVAYGPGLTMLRADKSPVAERVLAAGKEIPGLHLQACGNTLAGVTKKEGGVTPPLIEGVVVVPSGAVQLIELQMQGWSYLRP